MPRKRWRRVAPTVVWGYLPAYARRHSAAEALPTHGGGGVTGGYPLCHRAPNTAGTICTTPAEVDLRPLCEYNETQSQCPMRWRDAAQRALCLHSVYMPLAQLRACSRVFLCLWAA